jgi:hypothetical protein
MGAALIVSLGLRYFVIFDASTPKGFAQQILITVLNWFLGIALVYSTLFAIGQIIFGIWGQAALLIPLAGVSGVLMWWNLRRTSWSGLAEHVEQEGVDAVTEGAD